MKKRYEVNKQINKTLNDHSASPLKQDDETNTANFAIQNRFYEEDEVEDDIDTSLAMNSNIGAVLLPENDDD